MLPRCIYLDDCILFVTLPMYKYLIGKFVDPLLAIGIGVLAFKQWEFKQPGPSLYELVQEKYGTPSSEPSA